MALHDLVAYARAHGTIDDPLREQLARGQQPLAMFITCSDSRIIPSAITGSRPGELFELRTAGNIIPRDAGPTSEIATIEFAITVLGIADIILCGHSDCGAVAAMTGRHDIRLVPAVERWLARATGRPDRARRAARKRRTAAPAGPVRRAHRDSRRSCSGR